MKIRLAVEDMEPGHWIAWAIDLPACYSSARTETEAVQQASMQVAEYFTWLSQHDPSLPVPSALPEIQIVETFQSRPARGDPDYLVNAFFADDRRLLGYWDIEAALRLLDWTRQDLLAAIQDVSPEQMTQAIPGETRGSIAGILNHIAGAENWYLWQLGLGLETLPDDPAEKLRVVREHTRALWIELVGDERVVENSDECWSARKIVRRTLWHESDHTQHILKLGRGEK